MIFFKNTVQDKEGRVVEFEALDNDVSIGVCTLVLEEKYANITSLTYDKSVPFAAEGLLKSAYNYAALKNFYMAKCCVSDLDKLLIRLGFELNNNEYICDIPTILMGSCSGCSK